MATPLSARRLLLLATSLAAALPLPAIAQAPDQTQAASAAGVAAERDYDIAPGPLSAALARFVQQSGVRLTVDTTLIGQRQSPGLRGRYATPAGLAALLANTGLAAVRSGDSYLLRQAQSAGVVELRPVTITGDAIASPAAEVYRAPRSSVHVSSEEIDRYGATSPADLLKGLAGVQVGDARNGGALDVNIRGIQGQSRIAVTIDGTQQALDTYRGYAGAQQRSYMDVDFLKDITVNKGPGFSLDTPGAAAAIGGSVNFRTIEPADIVRPGNTYGIRLKGELWNNGIAHAKPYLRSSNRNDLFMSPRTERDNLFDGRARSGSIAAAYVGDKVDVLVAYAERQQGNYFAGKRGHPRYRAYNASGAEVVSAAALYRPGGEVFNTSSDTQTTLLKAALRMPAGQQLQLSHMRYRGSFGEIMPSDLNRFGDGKVSQFKPGTMDITTTTARYAYAPGHALVDLKAGLWMTDARNEQLNNGMPAASLIAYTRGLTRQRDRRYGVDLGNRSRLSSGIGDFTLDLGGAFQYQDIQPRKGVITTQQDRDAGRIQRDASRAELNLSTRLAWQPVQDLELWAAGRYNGVRIRDRNPMAVPILRRTSPWAPPVVLGATYRPPVRRDQSAFSPSLGAQYRFARGSAAYVNYSQGTRLPSLFESTVGGLVMTDTTRALQPERARNFELGVSTTLTDLLRRQDTFAAKLAYFDTKIDHYITRYANWSFSEPMIFSNAEFYQTRGLELQTRYDSGRYFGNLSATYYLKTYTCDAAAAAMLQNSLIGNLGTFPTCTDGSFAGLYANTQNPPRLALNLTAGLRLLENKLVLGGRVVYTSEPLVTVDKPWQTSNTTNQIKYRSVLVYDAFVNYQASESVALNLSMQNLTDRYYLDPLTLSMMPAPGRTIRLGATISF